MAYTVLARKYRSQTFTEVVGQEPIATTLVNAIKAGRIHHGYLFTGTRGVGKTSMARILAKALNCLSFDAPTTTPCNQCDACRAISEGQDVDVLEIDAASNTGVDNIRELRSNTAYLPARSRFKVYIIDEVHMLSSGAFNALLKTLEEPPEHVKFILATTEIQKVPATIQSRCQRFTFRHIGPDDIAQRLREIVKSEGSTAEEPVIQRIARLANGSMRDALSILDQLLSVSPTRLDRQVLDEILPPAQHERIVKLLEQAAEGHAAEVLDELDQLLSGGHGIEQFCTDMIEVIRTLLLIRTCGPDAALVDVPAGAAEQYQALAQRFELSHYVQMIPMLEELRRNVRYSGAGRALTEAVMVRIARMREWAAIEQLLRQMPAGTSAAATPPRSAPDSAGAGPRRTASSPEPAVDEKKKNPPVAVAEHSAEHTAPERTTNRAPAPLSGASDLIDDEAVTREPDLDYSDGALVAGDYDPDTPEAEPRPSGSGFLSEPRPAESGLLSGPRPAGSVAAGFEEPLPDGRGSESGRGPDRAVPAQANGRRELTGEARKKVEQDPVVRGVMELFGGVLMKVEQTGA
jgi:DNA polymerase III subunit gamma/tau